jgi:16S rRNA (adenine1518-N6/adenine1519-N6)-dimethyltransferase
VLRALGLRARKRLSQSFLADEGVCRLMAEAAGVGAGDDVLEIGPGLGVLTRVLLSRARRVVAVELDPLLAEHLPALAPGGHLEVVQGDALCFNPAEHFSGAYKLIANLPYQITSPVLTRYLIETRRPTELAVMVQREVAERILAGPGRATYLSMLTTAVAEARLVRQVPPGAFFPRPKVTSAVLHIRPRPRPAVPPEQLTALLRLVRAGFTQPRKTVANSLAQGLERPRAEIERALTAAGLDPRRRPQQLDLADWQTLFQHGLTH